MKKTLTTLTLASLAIAAIGAAVVYSGLINVGADDPHLDSVHALLRTARERSIAVRAADVTVPDLNDPALIRRGAGNYHSMCIGCHLAPGMDGTELSQNLYPAPPNLAQVDTDGSPATTFWVIKHGIKSTGMPAWGKSMADQYIWGMVAFLQQLPKLDAAQYHALVASSEGHAHGGMESHMHDHAGMHDSREYAAADESEQATEPHDEAHEHHHDHDAASDTAAPQQPAHAAGKVHVHADGTQHVHNH